LEKKKKIVLYHTSTLSRKEQEYQVFNGERFTCKAVLIVQLLINAKLWTIIPETSFVESYLWTAKGQNTYTVDRVERAGYFLLEYAKLEDLVTLVARLETTGSLSQF
jgi:hypothetical protein